MSRSKAVFLLFTQFVCFISACNEVKKESSAPGIAKEPFTGHPSWSTQSNIYEVNLRQYSASGSIKEFEKHLLRLKDMGVEILWFMPVTPIGIEGRKMTEKELGSYYAVMNYTGFNEEFGTMADWKDFVKNAQAMGFKVITDWVANHTAADNYWIKTHPEFYAKDSTGKIITPFDWTDVRKLDYRNREMRDSMIDAMKFWVNETGIDGFRCDVAEEVPVDFWKECIDSLRRIKHVFMLAEGEKASLHEAGFDATYTWSIMHSTADLYKGKISLPEFDSLLNAGITKFPATAYRVYFTSNHDENSWNGTEFEKYGNAYKTFAVLSQTIYQGIPLIYSGQEAMNKKRLNFFVKDTITWSNGYPAAGFYKTLLSLRKSNPALAAGASYKKLANSNEKAVFAYLREAAGRKVAVLLNLSGQPRKFTISDAGINGEPLNVFMGMKEKLSNNHTFSVGPWGFIVYDYQ
jgi:alpha-amylase